MTLRLVDTELEASNLIQNTVSEKLGIEYVDLIRMRSDDGQITYTLLGTNIMRTSKESMRSDLNAPYTSYILCEILI